MTTPHPAYNLLGHTVTDSITGLTGIVQYIDEFATGTIHCSIQPKGDGEKIPDGWNIDFQTLVLQVGGPTAEVTPIPNPSNLLGKQVEIVHTGFKGLANHRITHINGCETYLVEGRYNEALGKTPSMRAFTQELRDLSPKTSDPKLEAMEKPEPAKTRTGCAPVRAERF